MRGRSRFLSGAFDQFHAAVETARDDIPIMQERVFLEADIHEGRLQAVLQIADLAFEDAADEPFLGGALDGEFLQLAFFQHADARFERFGVDDDFLVGPFDRANQGAALF